MIQGGRPKAYRPLPVDDRRRAFAAGIAAYERGDFFEAHELLEPAWMGTDDPAERELDQGLIKLAAAFVHAVRGNPLGVARNLAGARDRLAAAAGTSAERDSGLDLSALVAAVDDRLARLAAEPDDPAIDEQEERMTMSGVPSVTATDAAALLEADAEDGSSRRPLLVDVRERDEFETVRVAGAFLLPISEFAARIGELPADRPLLVMCHLGSRSASATMFLRSQGRTDVTNVTGGIDAWERAGLPVRRGTPGPGEGDLPAT